MDYIDQMVTPLAGVWIEIKSAGEDVGAGGSVTPLAGVWIEMATAWQYISTLIVTPLAGVWIEMWKSMEA